MSVRDTFEAEIRRLAAILEVPPTDLPGFKKPAIEGAWIKVDRPALVYRYMYTERGSEELLFISPDAQDMLEYIFSGVTFSLAVEYELNHRIPKQDFRRLLFARQIELMRKLKPEWGDNELRRQAEILKENPFVDE